MEMHEPPQNHAATDCDCERLEKTGICVWFCVLSCVSFINVKGLPGGRRARLVRQHEA